MTMKNTIARFIQDLIENGRWWGVIGVTAGAMGVAIGW
jgi:hypothetical protein